jgi:hypothetical protein
MMPENVRESRFLACQSQKPAGAVKIHGTIWRVLLNQSALVLA